MELMIKKVEFIHTSNKTFVYMTVDKEFEAIMPQTWELGLSNVLKPSMAEVLHHIGTDMSDLGSDIMFALDICESENFEDVLKDILLGSTIELTQRHRVAGEVYTSPKGEEEVCKFDSISIESLKVVRLSPLGQYVTRCESWVKNDPKRKQAFIATRRLFAATTAATTAETKA